MSTTWFHGFRNIRVFTLSKSVYLNLPTCLRGWKSLLDEHESLKFSKINLRQRKLCYLLCWCLQQSPSQLYFSGNSYWSLSLLSFFFFIPFLEQRNFLQLKKKNSLFTLLLQSAISLFLAPFCHKAIQQGCRLTFPNCFLCIFYKSVPIESLPHHSTETSPVTITTDFILVNTKANSQPLL